jgi:hypothetical protein
VLNRHILKNHKPLFLIFGTGGGFFDQEALPQAGSTNGSLATDYKNETAPPFRYKFLT